MQDLAAKSCNKPVPRLRGVGPGDSRDCPEISRWTSAAGRRSSSTFTFVLAAASASCRLLLKNAANANASDAQGIKGRDRQVVQRRRSSPSRTFWLRRRRRKRKKTRDGFSSSSERLRGEQKPKKEPKSKYLDYVTKVAEAGPKGYLSERRCPGQGDGAGDGAPAPAAGAGSPPQHHEHRGWLCVIGTSSSTSWARLRRACKMQATCSLSADVFAGAETTLKERRSPEQKVGKRESLRAAVAVLSLATVQVFVVFGPTRPGTARRHL